MADAGISRVTYVNKSGTDARFTEDMDRSVAEYAANGWTLQSAVGNPGFGGQVLGMWLFFVPGAGDKTEAT